MPVTISDAHEWINEIPLSLSTTSEPQQGTGLQISGKEDPVELDSSLNCEKT